MMRIPSPLLVITDCHQARKPMEAIIAEAVSAGARWIWLRDRDLDPAERRHLAFRLAAIVRAAGGVLSVGSDVELADETGAGAAHMRDVAGVAQARARLGRSALIGLSAHSQADVTNGRIAGADYVTLSPIYATASKPGYGPALGIEAIRSAAMVGVPVVALGGISAENAVAARQAGAAGVAVMGSVMRAENSADAVKIMLSTLVPSDVR